MRGVDGCNDAGLELLDEVDVVELYPHSMKERARVSLGGNSAPGVRSPVGAVVDRRLPVLPGGEAGGDARARARASADVCTP